MTNPYLVLTTAFYLACKTEECPQHIKFVVSEARGLWPGTFYVIHLLACLQHHGPMHTLLTNESRIHHIRQRKNRRMRVLDNLGIEFSTRRASSIPRPFRTPTYTRHIAGRSRAGLVSHQRPLPDRPPTPPSTARHRRNGHLRRDGLQAKPPLWHAHESRLRYAFNRYARGGWDKCAFCVCRRRQDWS